MSNEKRKVIPAPFAKKPQELLMEAAKAAPDRSAKRSGRKKTYVAWSYFLFVILPTTLVALYYAFIAADQYMVETRFAVRDMNVSLGNSLLSNLGLGGGGIATSDTYIIREYIHSREILTNIEKKYHIKERYMKPKNDLWAALPKDSTFEEFLRYWKYMTQVDLDRISHIITIKVFAFSARDAYEISKAILEESERMINELSERARQDAVAYAEKEVAKAEERIREIRQKMLKFRSTTQQVDPAKQAEVQVALIGKLEEQLAHLKAKLAETRNYLSRNAPTVIFLRNRIKAVMKQIEDEKKKLGNALKNRDSKAKSPDMNTPLSETLSEYEELLVDKEFAEKLYLSALSGLEQARLIANKQQRYLATFVRPYVPDEARFPKRLRNTFFVFLALTLLWALSVVMFQSILDRI